MVIEEDVGRTLSVNTWHLRRSSERWGSATCHFKCRGHVFRHLACWSPVSTDLSDKQHNRRPLEVLRVHCHKLLRNYGQLWIQMHTPQAHTDTQLTTTQYKSHTSLSTTENNSQSHQMLNIQHWLVPHIYIYTTATQCCLPLHTTTCYTTLHHTTPHTQHTEHRYIQPSPHSASCKAFSFVCAHISNCLVGRGKAPTV